MTSLEGLQEKASSLLKEHGSTTSVAKLRLSGQCPLDKRDQSEDVWSLCTAACFLKTKQHISMNTSYQLSSTVVEV